MHGQLTKGIAKERISHLGGANAEVSGMSHISLPLPLMWLSLWRLSNVVIIRIFVLINGKHSCHSILL